jgi:hypothetical protein
MPVAAWFSDIFPNLRPVHLAPGDEFILNGSDEWALVLYRGRVVGYCARSEVGERAVVARDGLRALRRLGTIS